MPRVTKKSPAHVRLMRKLRVSRARLYEISSFIDEKITETNTLINGSASAGGARAAEMAFALAMQPIFSAAALLPPAKREADMEEDLFADDEPQPRDD